MRHSTSYTPDEQQDLLREMARGRDIGSGFGGSIALPFQKDFSEFLSSALDSGESFYAEFSNLRISVLRGTMAIPFHGTADFAVLEDSKTGTHVVLMGERGKANLRFRGGILAFQSSGQSPTNEITELFTSWETSIKPHKEKHGRHWYALRDEMRAIFRPMTAAERNHVDSLISAALGQTTPEQTTSTLQPQAKLT